MNETLKVRVRRTDPDTATVYAGRTSFPIARALEFDESAPLASAAHHLLAALGADLLLVFSSIADKRGLDIRETELTVTGRLNNPLVFLGVIGETGHAGFESITATLFVASDASEKTIGEVWRDAKDRSPCLNTLRRTVDLSLEVRVVP